MWIFTKYGFYSAVCSRQGDGSHAQPVDEKTIMVRCRLKSHLEALISRFANLIGQCEIKEFAGTDYAYRIFVEKAVWAQVLGALSGEMDYDNFKSAVARHQGSNGSEYEHSLHEVWSVMNRLQKS